MYSRNAFEQWFDADDYWDHSDPGFAMAQRAWNAALKLSLHTSPNVIEETLIIPDNELLD